MEKSNYSLTDILGQPTTQEKVLCELQKDEKLYESYLKFDKEDQGRLLDFLRGKKGLCITYDNFFKMVMNPSVYPERLESFLCAILGQEVTIESVLSLDGTTLAENGSQVIMDMLVKLADGSVVDVEIQKIGYIFPGERSSCYASDLIMRQYNRVKGERGKKFSFYDLKPVYLIVIMENSARVFKNVAPQYIHREQIAYDSGAQVNSLSKTIYISLDTFHSVVQNISDKLEGWLTFLSEDNPEKIVKLVNAYPEFLPCYQDIVKFRRDPRELIYMYSEALSILDKNTTLLMWEEYEEEIKQKELKIAELDSVIEGLDTEIAEKNTEIAEKNTEIAEKNTEIAEKNTEIAEKNTEIAEKNTEIAEKNTEIAEKDLTIESLRREIEQLKRNT